MSVKVAEILNDMKAVLIEEGWVQGAFSREGGGYCLMGSLTRSGVAKRHGHVYTGLVLDALDRVLPRTILGFNDAPGRTFNEVIDLIDAAILKEKESAL